MANWCYNHVVFTGAHAAIDAISALFREISTKQEESNEWYLPPYVTAENSHMLDIDIGEKGIEYSTRWTPNLEAVIQIAEHFNAAFTHRYDEPQMFVIGEATFRHGLYEHVSLDAEDAENVDHWNEPAKVAELLAAKREAFRAVRAAGIFRSEGDMTADELQERYGGLAPADLVLKLAEYKNFDAAREMFRTLDEGLVNELDNCFIRNRRQPESLFKTEDKYIAVCFLKELLNERDRNNTVEKARQLQQELIAIRLAGRLPHIDINGTDFTVDLRLRELRETESPWNAIDLSELETELNSDDYEFFYDIVNHNIWMFEDDVTEMPENVVMVTLPDDMVLDPVAAARAVGHEETEYLAEYPIQQNLKAGVRPLSETFFPKFIAENREAKYGRDPGGDDFRPPKIGR